MKNDFLSRQAVSKKRDQERAVVDMDNVRIDFPRVRAIWLIIRQVNLEPTIKVFFDRTDLEAEILDFLDSYSGGEIRVGRGKDHGSVSGHGLRDLLYEQLGGSTPYGGDRVKLRTYQGYFFQVILLALIPFSARTS